MTTQRRNCLLLVLGIAFLGSGAAWAQTPMAAHNLGQRVVPDDARMVGRGGWGMATADTTHPGFKNLASLSYLRHIVVKYTGYGELADAESPQGARRTSGVYSPGLQLALPVIKNRLGVTMGFSMNGSSRWDARVDTSFALADSQIGGGVVLARKGTRFKVPLGVAWRVRSGLSLAGAVNLESGSSLQNVNEAFRERGFDTNFKETRDLFSGTSYTVAALWRPTGRLSVGASWTPAFDLRVERQVKAVGVSSHYQTGWDSHLPDEYMAGFQLRLSKRWQLGADAQYMPFTQFRGRDSWASEIVDEKTVGLGFERRRAHQRRGGLNNLPFRFGVGHHRWGYRVGGAELDDYSVSVGTGFAFAGDLGQLDLSLSYVVIGDLAKNGVQSRVYRLGVSITGLEAWW